MPHPLRSITKNLAAKLAVAFSVGLVLALAATVSLPAASAQDTFEVVHPFNGAVLPVGALTRDAAGNVYGTTEFGGNLQGKNCSPSGCGTIWKASPNVNGGWTTTVLYAFSNQEEGSTPLGGLILDAAGNLYGTTWVGGPVGPCRLTSYSCGVVFELKANANGTWTYIKLHDFALSDGALPNGSMVFDKNGNLYGTTQKGGSDQANCIEGCGTVFKLSPNGDETWSETVILNFNGSRAGAAGGYYPNGAMIFDNAGNLYGTASFGGDASCLCGVVFKLTPNSNGTWSESVLHTFTTFEARYPFTGVIWDGSGNLYGTTLQYAGRGGPGTGTVFELSPSSGGNWAESVLHIFTGKRRGGPPDGNAPMGVTFDNSSNLYGTTEFGGKHGTGVIFELTPGSSGWSENIVHTFSSTGADPQAPLLIDSASHIYGTTGGQLCNKPNCNTGFYQATVFEITP